jgi:hypothetical protein
MFAPDSADWPQLLKLAMSFTSGRPTIQSGGSAQKVNQRLVVRQENWKDRYQEESSRLAWSPLHEREVLLDCVSWPEDARL